MYVHDKWILKIFICLMIGIALTALGEEAYRKTPFVETKVVDSFSIGVSDQDGCTNSAPDRYVTFTIWSTNGPVHVAFPPQPEAAYQVELFDTNGVSVPKTVVGKMIGRKFADFGESALKKIVRINQDAVKKSEPAPWTLMFRPIDVFQIDKPGNYTLRIWFQILAFPRTGQNRDDYKKQLIRFPALDYPLVQPKLTNGS